MQYKFKILNIFDFRQYCTIRSKLGDHIKIRNINPVYFLSISYLFLNIMLYFRYSFFNFIGKLKHNIQHTKINVRYSYYVRIHSL